MTREQHDSVEPVLPNDLSSPRFDRTTVAVAQPVEPLPPARFSLSNLSLQPAVIIGLFGLVLITVASVAGLLTFHSQRATTTQQSIVEQPTTTSEAPVQAEMTPADVVALATAAVTAATNRDHAARPRKGGTRLRQPDQISPVSATEDGRPVARKIGEIRYGRSVDRP